MRNRCLRWAWKILGALTWTAWSLIVIIGILSVLLSHSSVLENLPLGWQIPLVTFALIVTLLIWLTPLAIWFVWKEGFSPQAKQYHRNRTLWTPPPFELLKRRWEYHQLRALKTSEKKAWLTSAMSNEQMDWFLFLCVEAMGLTSLSELTLPELTEWYENGQHLPRILKILADTPLKSRKNYLYGLVSPLNKLEEASFHGK